MSKKCEIYVGNVPANVSNQQLHELFSQVGNVLNVWVKREFKRITYAFICFGDLETCDDACKQFDNYELGSSKLNVKMSFKNEKKEGGKSILREYSKKKGTTKQHALKLILLKNLKENKDINESFKLAMQEAENVTDIDKFEVVKHVGESCNLKTLEETVIRNFQKPRQKKPIAIDIDLTKGKRLSLEENDRLFNVTTTTTTKTTTTTTTDTKAKQRRRIPVSMDYRSVCE